MLFGGTRFSSQQGPNRSITFISKDSAYVDVHFLSMKGDNKKEDEKTRD